MVSFGIDAALVTLGAFASASVARLLEGQRPPALHWQVMRVPGSIAGTLWAIANFCGIAAVARGGNAVVMAQMQATQLVTSGLWGILWYKEIHGQALVVWSAFAVWTSGAIVLLGMEKGDAAAPPGVQAAASAVQAARGHG